MYVRVSAEAVPVSGYVTDSAGVSLGPVCRLGVYMGFIGGEDERR